MLWWFIQQLKSRKPEARIAAAEKLAASGKPEAINALAEAAADPEITVRRAVTLALGAFRHDSVAIPLTGLLNDLAPEVREAAALALGQAHALCAERPLIAALKDTNTEVRKAAARALYQLGWQPQTSDERAVHSIATGKFMQATQDADKYHQQYVEQSEENARLHLETDNNMDKHMEAYAENKRIKVALEVC